MPVPALTNTSLKANTATSGPLSWAIATPCKVWVVMAGNWKLWNRTVKASVSNSRALPANGRSAPSESNMVGLKVPAWAPDVQAAVSRATCKAARAMFLTKFQ